MGRAAGLTAAIAAAVSFSVAPVRPSRVGMRWRPRWRRLAWWWRLGRHRDGG
jgi:hypothetical protein